MTEYSDPIVIDEFRTLAASILHIETGTIDIDKPLNEAGMNSIEIIDFIRQVERRYNIQIQPEKLSDFTLAGIAAAVPASARG